jgi:hypothetical protein
LLPDSLLNTKLSRPGHPAFVRTSTSRRILYQRMDFRFVRRGAYLLCLSIALITGCRPTSDRFQFAPLCRASCIGEQIEARFIINKERPEIFMATRLFTISVFCSCGNSIQIYQNKKISIK